MSLRWLASSVGGLIIIWIMSWKLTLIMFAIIPLIAFGTFHSKCCLIFHRSSVLILMYFLGAWIYGKYVRTKSQAVQQALADVS
jgi:ABC-type multidrug transport system fused ATPase/permease subunit